jgi:GNAT superfamily N-acetyltransferase
MLPNVEVGYVEGLYIEPEFRGRGITRRLLRFAQDWARKERCAAFASDRDGRIILDPRYRLKEAEPALA